MCYLMNTYLLKDTMEEKLELIFAISLPTTFFPSSTLGYPQKSISHEHETEYVLNLNNIEPK